MVTNNEYSYIEGLIVPDFNIKSTEFSPMDQFEIKSFFGELLGLNYTPIGNITNISIYIGLVVLYTLLFYIYAGFKEKIKING